MSRRRRWAVAPRRRGLVGLMAVAALVLAGCSGSDAPTGGVVDLDPDPIRVDGPATAADLAEQHPPEPFADRVIVDAGWSTPPQAVGDLFLGLRPGGDAVLKLTAVDATGKIRWVAKRPLACTGFTTTTVGDRALAVLTDLAPGTDTVTVTTATAYDLATGEQVWGPVEVPGAHVGPGLVYAQMPAATLGAGGPRVALDNATGTVVADEQDLGGDVVGEYDGTVLLTVGGDLVARRAANGKELWRSPVAELGLTETDRVVAAPSSVRGGGTALLGTAITGYSLVDLADGTVRHPGLRQARADLATGTQVVLTTDSELRALDTGGETRWTRAVEPTARIEAVGAGAVFIRADRHIWVHDLATGEPLDAYPDLGSGTAAVPVHITASGAAVLDTLPTPFLVTIDPE